MYALAIPIPAGSSGTTVVLYVHSLGQTKVNAMAWTGSFIIS